MRYWLFYLNCDTGRAVFTRRYAKKKIILAPFIKNPFSQSSHISSAEIVWQLVDNCQYFLNHQTLNIFRCWVVCQTKQDIWKYLGLRETAWKLWSTLKCMEVGDSTEYTTENWVFCQRSYEVNLVSYSPSSNSSHTSANTVICCLWKVKSKNSDTNSTAVWLTLTPANQSVIQAVSRSTSGQPSNMRVNRPRNILLSKTNQSQQGLWSWAGLPMLLIQWQHITLRCRVESS